LGAVEFILSAGPGGKGTVWLEDFRLEDRTCRNAPEITASSSGGRGRPEDVLARTAKKAWRSAASDSHPWLQFDFHQPREYGGLIVEWEPNPAIRAFTV